MPAEGRGRPKAGRVGAAGSHARCIERAETPPTRRFAPPSPPLASLAGGGRRSAAKLKLRLFTAVDPDSARLPDLSAPSSQFRPPAALDAAAWPW